MPVFENFISYRRSETLLEVKNIYDALKNRGFSVFCDVYSLDNGNFDENLIKYIETCTNYILVLNNRSLDRCSEEDDWLFKEIKQSMLSNKNIVLVCVGEVDFHNLPQEIDNLRYKNGLKFDVIYFEPFMDELTRRFLVPPSDWQVSGDSDFIIQNGMLIRYTGSAKNVIIPDEVEIIGRSAFKDNTSIKDVTFGSNIRRIEDSAFERCISLVNITLPPTVENLGKRAFARCYALANITLHDNLAVIGEECFAFCTSLKLIYLPKNLDICAGSAFNDCDSLSTIKATEDCDCFTTQNGILYNKEMTTLIRCPIGYPKDYILIPDSIKRIGNYAFAKCGEITGIILPPNLKAIGKFAFEECSKIESITLPKTITALDKTAFDGWPRERIFAEEGASRKLLAMIERCMQENVLEESEVKSEYVLVKTTFEAESEAVNMAKAFLEKKLIVSGQITRLRSIYTWEGQICDENEFELSCITRGEMYSKIESFINAHHSFELCELMCIPIEHVPPLFGDWVTSYVKEGK